MKYEPVMAKVLSTRVDPDTRKQLNVLECGHTTDSQRMGRQPGNEDVWVVIPTEPGDLIPCTACTVAKYMLPVN